MVAQVVRTLSGDRRAVGLVLQCLLLAACAGYRGAAPTPALTIPADDAVQGSPALALVKQAADARARGDAVAASRYLERALGITPDSSWIYRQLGDIRLQSGDAAGAEGLIQRALRLAGNDPDYRASLWDMIAVCRARQGDDTGAAGARDQAARLRARR